MVSIVIIPGGDVERYVVGATAADQTRGIVAKLTRAMVIGPIYCTPQ